MAEGAGEHPVLARPLFISVDGIDGAGKTTLCARLADWIGRDNVVLTKEPTADSPYARKIRDGAEIERLSREEELDLFRADRRWHLANRVEPALEQGKTVITDRYVDSTLAFQAHSPEEADTLFERMKSEIRIPDVAFILDCPLAECLRRIEEGRDYRSTFETEHTLERAKAIYDSRRGQHYVHLASNHSPEDTFQAACDFLRGFIDTGLQR